MTDRWRTGANLATLGNGLLGVGAIAYVLAGNKVWAMLLVVMAIGFDGLDGLLSRKSPKPPSRFGRVADSLADATSFGLAPAFFVAVHTGDVPLWAPYASATTLAAALYLGAALARLTYFTVRAHALPHFRGVPTPESALAIVVALLFLDTPAFYGVQPLVLLFGVGVVALMMLVPVAYPKIRRGSRLRLPTAATGVLGAVALLPLQFRPPPGSAFYLVALGGSLGLLVGVAAYYFVGPFTVTRPASAGGEPA